MKIPFYQTTWLGTNLVEISTKINHDPNHLAGSHFYNQIYQVISKKQNFQLDKIWLEKKKTLSLYLENILNRFKMKRASILSLGCGFGIVEQPLIQHGFKIDLQECQEYSIEYLKNNYNKEFKKTKFILSENLSNIPSNSYDAILSITSTYCLDDKTLQNFLKEAARILKKEGILVWYETALTVTDIESFMKKKILFLFSGWKMESVLWGWKRSLGCQKKAAKKQKFVLLDHTYLDGDNKIASPKKLGGLPISNVSWQLGIYRLEK